MKIIFQFARTKELHEEEIDPKASLEQVRDMIKSKYTLPEGNVLFIHGGAFLRNPEPFSKLKERSKIVVYVKEIVQKPPEEVPPMDTPNEQVAQRPQEERPRLQTDEEIIEHFMPILTRIIDSALVENLYNPDYNFWNHPEEIYEISQILNDNLVALSIIQDFVNTHYYLALETFPPTAVLDIIGCKYQILPKIMSDLEAGIQELSDTQKTSYRRLLTLGFDQKLTYDKFKECGFNEDQTRACLSQLPK